jgi:hypothetical protein
MRSSSLVIVGAAAFAIAAAAAIGSPAAPVTSPLLSHLPGSKGADGVEVDVELVLAVDISYSMDPEEQALQREGYAAALRSSEFLQALRGLTYGRIALTYFEWAGFTDQKIIIPWRMIDGPEAADSVAAEIVQAPFRRASRTSISGALTFAAPLFERNGYRGLRHVIDVSGDGANNHGPPVTILRDEVIAKGITINGLPILLKRAYSGTMDIENLDVYYEDCVIGGPGAFVIPIKEREKFAEAIRTKLVLEIAEARPPVLPAAASAPRISCMIGERMWQQRWGDGIDYR